MMSWRDLFNAALVKHFVITVADAGLDEFELTSLERDFPSDPHAAAMAFGEEHDLTDVQKPPYGRWC